MSRPRLVPQRVTHQAALWRLFDRYPHWRDVLIALRESPGSTAGDLVRAGAVTDASNANGSLRALEGRGLVERRQDGRASRWRLRAGVAAWLDEPAGFVGVAEVIGDTRLGLIARDDLEGLARVLLSDGLAEHLDWAATFADRQIGAVVRFSKLRSTTDVVTLRGRLQEQGVALEDMRVEDVVVGRSELTTWARRVLGLDAGRALPP